MRRSLKPCPFCGSEDVIIDHESNNTGYADSFDGFCIYCGNKNCIAHIPFGQTVKLYRNPMEAIEAWQRRADNAG